MQNVNIPCERGLTEKELDVLYDVLQYIEHEWDKTDPYRGKSAQFWRKLVDRFECEFLQRKSGMRECDMVSYLRRNFCIVGREVHHQRDVGESRGGEETGQRTARVIPMSEWPEKVRKDVFQAAGVDFTEERQVIEKRVRAFLRAVSEECDELLGEHVACSVMRHVRSSEHAGARASVFCCNGALHV